jgi:hypothetical protein
LQIIIPVCSLFLPLGKNFMSYTFLHTALQFTAFPLLSKIKIKIGNFYVYLDKLILEIAFLLSDSRE